MNQLPKYWVIQLLSGDEELYRELVIPYIEKNYNGANWYFITNNYIGVDGNSMYLGGTRSGPNLSSFNNNPTVLTLQQFIQMTTNQLPEKWCIRVDNNIIIGSWFNDHSTSGITSGYDKCKGYLHYPDISKIHHFSNIRSGYTEITFEQFNKYILKQEQVMKKETGYQLINDTPEIRTAVRAITNCSGFDFDGFKNRGVNDFTQVIKELTELKLLDLWFEPYYDEQFKVDDVAICIGEEKNQYVNGFGWEKDLIFKITKIKSGNIAFGGKNDNGVFFNYLRLATPAEIESYNSLIIDSYKVEIKGNLVCFGCNEFTKEQLQAYKHLLELNHVIQTINGTKITSTMVDKLISMI